MESEEEVKIKFTYWEAALSSRAGGDTGPVLRGDSRAGNGGWEL